jgi:hypothetical protein
MEIKSPAGDMRVADGAFVLLPLQRDDNLRAVGSFLHALNDACHAC